MQGQETTFICGSDTHGTPIVVNAEEQGITPSELIEEYHRHFQEVFKKLRVDFDFFGSTDAPSNHHRTTEIIKTLQRRGYVYPLKIHLAYCPKCDRFLPDRFVEGTCPHCGTPARGDECDQGCGRYLEPGEIRDAKCKVCGDRAEYREQEHYFFKLQHFKPMLREYLTKLEGTSNARNYALKWVDELRDWCITRNLEWGVHFPGREDIVVYVWVDAPIGYISFTEEWARQTGGDWEKYWKGDSRIIHFIGGDIIYHHCIFWPAMLEGAGYTKPWAVAASGMLKIEDKKFSKTRGIVVWTQEDYLEAGFHPDLLRYYLASYTSHTKDLNFSWRIFQEKVNSELVGSLGNFLYRTLHFTHKNFPQIPATNVDPEITDRIKKTIEEYTEALEEYEFKKLVDTAMALADYGNTYFQGEEPWHLIKQDRDSCASVVKNSLQLAKAIVLLFYPILPQKMEEAWSQLGQQDIHHARLEEALQPIAGEIKKPAILFEKIEDKKIQEMEARLEERIKKASKENGETREPRYSEISDLEKLDLRIGEILKAETIPGSKKLLKLEIDLGDEKRQIVAGIAQTHTPQQLKGRCVVVAANLKPVKLFGIESQGMLLAAGTREPVLLQPEKPVKPGAKIR